MLDQPMTSKMIAEKDGAIGRLIFNNPARHNAVSLEMWEAVTQIIDDFERDDAIRVIVVSGAGGRAFVSGVGRIFLVGGRSGLSGIRANRNVSRCNF